MKIAETYSHLDGLEYLLVHRPKLWDEIQTVVGAIDGEACRTKVSQEKDKAGEILYSPVAMNDAFRVELGGGAGGRAGCLTG